jgi:flagellar basal-body rod modification protein FlgD
MDVPDRAACARLPEENYMLIDSTTATNPLTDPQAGQDASPTTVGSPNEFLRLFIAQLANQNPLDPQDGAEFVAQLAQFTSVEQAAETNRRLEEILAGQMSVSNASLAGFVGRLSPSTCPAPHPRSP